MSDPDHSLVAIYIAENKQSPMQSVASANAIAGEGLQGDRYLVSPKHSGPDREITLIESESIESVPIEFDLPLELGESRRNLVTRGVRLNDLVGKTFQVGEVVLKGHRLCHPCSHLQKMTRPGILKALVNRGGLRAEILVGGTIAIGDLICLKTPSEAAHA